MVYCNGHIFIMFHVYVNVFEYVSVFCSYMEYIFDDVDEARYSYPNDVIYKQNNNPDNFNLITKKIDPWSKSDGLATSLLSSCLTLKYQYWEVSAFISIIHMSICLVSKFCLFVFLLMGVQRYFFLTFYLAKRLFTIYIAFFAFFLMKWD